MPQNLPSIIFQNPSAVELISFILSYAIGIPPEYALCICHDIPEIEPVKIDGRVQELSTHARVQTLKNVHPIWEREVDRIIHRYGFIDTYRMATDNLDWPDVSSDFNGIRGQRVRRMFINARSCKLPDLERLSHVLDLIPNVVQLRIRIELAFQEPEEPCRIFFRDAFTRFLSKSKLKLLRWNCSFLDVIQCTTCSPLERLIIDKNGVTGIDDGPVSLPNLVSIEVTFASRFPLPVPRSNVLSILSKSNLPSLQNIVTTSNIDVPYFTDLLQARIHSLRRIVIRDRPSLQQTNPPPLPSLPSLTFFAFPITSAPTLLTTCQPSLEVLYISGFVKVSLRDREFRQRNLHHLVTLTNFVTRPDVMPSLRIVRLIGMSDFIFSNVFWYPIEEVRLAFCYWKLHGKGVTLEGEDEKELVPRLQMKRLTSGTYSHEKRYCPFL